MYRIRQHDRSSHVMQHGGKDVRCMRLRNNRPICFRRLWCFSCQITYAPFQCSYLVDFVCAIVSNSGRNVHVHTRTDTHRHTQTHRETVEYSEVGSDYSGLDCSEPATTRVVQVLRARKPGQRKTWQPYLPPYHIARTRGQTRRIYQHKQLEH